MKLVVLGLSLSSSWGNGHATTYRALLKALRRSGHEILFL
jgi:spore maturation protein CgeB